MLNAAKLKCEAARLSEQDRSNLGVYVSEAVFFLDVLSKDLSQLKPESRVIEVGSGIGLLSLLIGGSGLQVDSYEPASAGFGKMAELRSLILRCWEGPINVTWFDGALPRELDPALSRADYLIAIHVLEHVSNPMDLIASCMTWIKPEGEGRFVLPNYAFPYEPHFGFPTLGRKRWTYWLWRRKIAESSIPDAQDFWNDLSWPTLNRFRRDLYSRRVGFQFSRAISRQYVSRLVTDETFRERMHVTEGVAIRCSRILRGVLRVMPTSVLPLMDLKIRHKRNANS